MAVVLELECAGESWRLSKYRLLGLTLRGPRWGLRTGISTTVPDDAATAGWGSHFERTTCPWSNWKENKSSAIQCIPIEPRYVPEMHWWWTQA